jgi:hypothetical protein
MGMTPGPWGQYDDGGSLSGGSGFEYTYGRAYADCVWGPNGPGHGLIADCSPNGQSATPETIANARAIAALPELVEAAQEVLITRNCDAQFRSIAYGRLTAALQKAGL